MDNEKEIITEFTVDIETKSDSFGPTQPNNGEKIDQIIVQPHNGKEIDQLIVSQEMSYAVTYSKEDYSVRGWSVNVEEDGQLQPDVYFKLDKSYEFKEFLLYKNILFCYYNDDRCKYLF